MAFTGPLAFVDPMVVTEWEPPNRCVLRHTGSLVRGDGVFEVFALPRGRSRFAHFCWYHSLTIVLVISGVAWAVAFARMDPNSKTGQVIGNIVSEWTQVLGLVVLTKYAHEVGSKES